MKELNLIKHIDKISHHSPKIILNEYSKKILNKLKSELKDIYNKVFQYNDYNIEKLKNQYIRSSLFKSIPIEIQNIIENEKANINVIIYQWRTTIKGSDYNIKLYINYGNKQNNGMKHVMESKIIEYYGLIRMIIEFLINHSKNKLKRHNISIYLYLTTHIKVVPDKKNDTVGWINVNTGLTTFCNENTEINIFRVEEWFKVLIHESIHNLCMDFSSIDTRLYHSKLKEIFIMNSDYLLFETYTELWAEIIQILFLLVLSGDANINKRFTNELLFSIIQSNKMFSLCPDGIGTYNDLINKNKDVLKLYKEDSNCFSYYVLKMIGLYNINDFILWCSNKNKDDILQFDKKMENIVDFIHFFYNRYRNTELVNYINVLNVSIKETKGIFINETLRISIYEVIV